MRREEEIRQAATDYTKKQTAGILGGQPPRKPLQKLWIKQSLRLLKS